MTDPLPPTDLVSGFADYATRATRMVNEAYTEVVILSQELDRRIYGTESFSESVRRFVLSSPNARVRIIVNSTQAAIANSPRLVEFGRTLTTFIEFRELLPARQQTIREEYVLTDGRILLYRETPQDLEARYYGSAPHVARLQLKSFDTLWDEAPPAQELRRLHL